MCRTHLTEQPLGVDNGWLPAPLRSCALLWSGARGGFTPASLVSHLRLSVNRLVRTFSKGRCGQREGKDGEKSVDSMRRRKEKEGPRTERSQI